MAIASHAAATVRPSPAAADDLECALEALLFVASEQLDVPELVRLLQQGEPGTSGQDGLEQTLTNELMELGYKHKPFVMAGDPQNAEDHLPLIHVVISNLKTWLLGTHRGRIEVQYLQAYLNEYVFRFNRRFYPMNAFNSVLGLAARSVSPTYEELYSGA